MHSKWVYQVGVLSDSHVSVTSDIHHMEEKKHMLYWLKAVLDQKPEALVIKMVCSGDN